MILVCRQALRLILALLAGVSTAHAFHPWQLEADSPLESRLLEEMATGHLRHFSLLEAALIASGVDNPPDLQGHLELFATLQQTLLPLPGDRTPDAVRDARAMLDWLHRHVLTGDYQPTCTEIDRTLQTGHFNCVTSTVLYRSLADARGLTLETVCQPDHVFCRLPGNAEPILIQTTSRTGIVGPGLSDSRSSTAVQPDTKDSPSRVISDVQLVAKIYYNRGAVLLKNNAYAEALPWLLRAVKFDPDDSAARANLLACVNNWALAESRAADFPGALRLLKQGRTRAPDYAPFSANEVYVYYSWIRHLAGQQRFAEAIEVLDAAHARHPSISIFAQGRERISEIWLHCRNEIEPTEAR